MPRLLDAEFNALRIFDPISDEYVTFLTRQILPEERVQYAGRIFKKDPQGKVYINTDVRLEFAEKILAGVSEKYFQITEHGKVRFISSKESSPDYYENWKKLVVGKCSELLVLVSMHYFENIRVDGVKSATDIEVSEEQLPLESGSGGTLKPSAPLSAKRSAKKT